MSTVNRTFIFDSLISGGTGSTCCNIINFAIEGIASGSTIDNVTFLGYGEETACKILMINTISGTSYNSFWSNGEETLNKIWANRLTYSYF